MTCRDCGAPLATRTISALGVNRAITIACSCQTSRDTARREATLDSLGESVWALSQVPTRFRGAQLDTSVPRPVGRAVNAAIAQLPDYRDRAGEPNMREALGRIRPGGRGLGLWGPVGTGKTHAIAAYLRAARERLIPGVLLPASSLQLQLESAQRFSNHETSGALVARYVQIPILALDDVDKLLPTSPSVALAIYELLDARWREERPLCLTCNVEPRDLAGVVFERFERHGVAIDDRWLDMTDWAAYPGASRRGQRVPAEAR